MPGPAWGYDEHTGRRVVESKDETKKIGRSPDDADAQLAYLVGVVFERPTPIGNPPRRPLPGAPGFDPRNSRARRSNLYGMR